MSEPIDPQRLASRLKALRAERGWDMSTLEERSGIGRTTLYHLEQGHTASPRMKTLNRIAAAFEVPVASLLQSETAAPRPVIESSPLLDVAQQAAFDRETNPMVTEVIEERPDLFRHWSENDFDELYSIFGTGGPLTRKGVVVAAESINIKRETVRRLEVLLETQLRSAAIEVINSLYRVITPGEDLQP